MLAQRDFNLSDIGTLFELDEVTPVFETEVLTGKNGEIILDKTGNPRKFQTDIIIGYNYSVTILDGLFRKKSTQIKVLDPDSKITNKEIMNHDSIKCNFENLETSMIGNPMYYRADDIKFIEERKK